MFSVYESIITYFLQFVNKFLQTATTFNSLTTVLQQSYNSLTTVFNSFQQFSTSLLKLHKVFYKLEFCWENLLTHYWSVETPYTPLPALKQLLTACQKLSKICCKTFNSLQQIETNWNKLCLKPCQKLSKICWQLLEAV